MRLSRILLCAFQPNPAHSACRAQFLLELADTLQVKLVCFPGDRLELLEPVLQLGILALQLLVGSACF